jgi:hypothetical protein
MATPDPDAQAIMSILLNSPIEDTAAGLLSAARAYEAVKRIPGEIPTGNSYGQEGN